MASVTLNISKCKFGKEKKVKFLAYIISADGMMPAPDRTLALQDMKEPINLSKPRHFLGILNQ